MPTKSEGIKVLNNTLSSLNTILTKSYYSVWVKFTIGEFVINTASMENNYFMHLENVKNGTGQANQFTITLAYVPRLGPGLSGTIYDADYLDQIIVQSNRKCKIQYGYSHSQDNLISPEYNGMIIDYGIEIRDGMLLYTLTGYSGLVAIANTSLNFDAKKNMKPTEAVAEELTAKLANLGYTVEWEDGVKGSDKLPTSTDDSKTPIIPAMSDVTLFQYVDSVLGMAVYEGNDINTDDPLKLSTYYYNISDSDMKIYIGRNDPTEESVNTQSAIFVFNWMDRTNNIVLDFKPDFKGSVLMSMASQIASDSYAIGPDGKKVDNTRYISNFPIAGGQAVEDGVADVLTWSDAVKISYKATLMLVGVPCEVPIGAYIKVVPLIYGKPHHTQGTYMVTKCTDIIDSGGFISSLNLVKINSEEVTNFTTMISQTSASSNMPAKSEMNYKYQETKDKNLANGKTENGGGINNGGS